MKLPDYPFKPARIDLDGYELYYLDEGPPDSRLPVPPVVMLNGNLHRARPHGHGPFRQAAGA